MRAATTASTDDISKTLRQGQCAPIMRTPCGNAVPNVSMPTSQASAAPDCCGAQLITSFMPRG